MRLDFHINITEIVPPPPVTFLAGSAPALSTTLVKARVFLSRSAQRVWIFQDYVEREVSGSASSRQKLKPICATRWAERHDSIIIFVTLLPAVVSTLEELQQENKQVEVATKAATLLNSVQKCTF